MRTVVETARTMLEAKNIDKIYCAIASDTAMFILTERIGRSTVKLKFSMNCG